MSNNRFLPILGAILATPALTAAFEPAQAHDIDARSRLDGPPASAASGQAAETLKTELLRLAPADKLAISGDRLGASPADDLGLTRAPTVLKGGGAEYAERAAAPRTHTDIPECRAPSADAKSAGGGGTGVAPRTNTDIPECQAAAAKGSGAAGAGAALRTNTNIPECLSPNASAKGAGASGWGGSMRTNTDIPECQAAAAKGSGASGAGAAPRTNTDIPECQAAAAKGAGVTGVGGATRPPRMTPGN
jgi:hypothetical protein